MREERKNEEERADRNRSPSTIARTGPFCKSRAWKPLTPTKVKNQDIKKIHCSFVSSILVKHLGSCVSLHVRSCVKNPRSRCRQPCLAFLSRFPRTESCPRQSGSTCGATIANSCVIARTVAQKSWPTAKTCKS